MNSQHADRLDRPRATDHCEAPGCDCREFEPLQPPAACSQAGCILAPTHRIFWPGPRPLAETIAEVRSKFAGRGALTTADALETPPRPSNRPSRP